MWSVTNGDWFHIMATSTPGSCSKQNGAIWASGECGNGQEEAEAEESRASETDRVGVHGLLLVASGYVEKVHSLVRMLHTRQQDAGHSDLMQA